MTGAGAGRAAFAKEDSFLGSLKDEDSSGNPDWWRFGRDETVSEASLDNQLQRLSESGAIESVNAVKTNFEGAATIEAVVSSDVHADVEELVFNDDGSGFTVGRPLSAAIAVGLDYIDGKAERLLEGAIVTDYELSYTQGEMLTYTITFIYADESNNASFTPSEITSATDGSEAAHHALSLDINGTTIQKLQSSTLSISNIYGFQRGSAGPTPVDATIRGPETSLDVEAIFAEPRLTEIALGDVGVSSPQDRVAEQSATLSITIGGTTLSTYNLTVVPATLDWADVVAEDDATQSVSFEAVDGVSVA